MVIHLLKGKKIEALKLEEMVDGVIYCMDYDAPKPSLIQYFEAIDKANTDVENVIVIGDDPYCDMKAAADLGVDAYRVLQGKHTAIMSINDTKPKAHFESIFMLAKHLLKEE